MKNAKKLLSLFLAVALAVGILPTSVFATKANILDLTSFNTVSEIDGLSAQINSDKNIAKGLPYSTVLGTDGSYNYRTATANIKNYVDPLLNGVVEDNHKDIGGFRHLDDEGEYINNDIFITLNFGAEAKIDAIALIGSTATPYWARIEEYEIYASDSVDTLYNAESLLTKYTNSTTEKERNTSQYFKVAKSLKAKHIGIRIIKALNKNSSSPFYKYSYLRACELVVLGKLDLSAENAKPTSVYNANLCIKDLKTDYNLLSDGYDFTDYPDTDGIHVTGYLNGQTSAGFSPTNYTTDNDLLDGNVKTHLDISASIDQTRIVYLNSDGNFNDAYYTLTTKLKKSAKIDKIFLSFITDTLFWQASEYEVYLSDKFDTLYTSEPVKTVATSEVKSEPYGTIVFETPVTAQYVGIKITKGVKDCANIIKQYGASSTYLRIAEFAIFGKYDVPYYDCKVSANKSGIFDEYTANVYEGKNVTVTGPLTKDGKTFVGLYVDGTRYDVIKGETEFSADVEVLDNIEIIADYVSDPSEIESETFTVDNKNRIIKTFADTTIWDIGSASENARSNLVAKKGDTTLKNGDILATGNTIDVIANGNTANTYTVLQSGDIYADGKLNVTDIVAGIDYVLKGNADDILNFRFDMNNDGVLSASDVVYARAQILDSPTVENYNAKTYITSEMPKKIVGRGRTNTDGSVTFDWAASTLMFNADCYGDIVVTVANEHSNNYYRVVVDGKETEIYFFTGGKQKEITIAKNLEKGKHTIEFYKETQGLDPITFYSVTVNGELCDPPKNKDLLIEFCGDSITCGESILGSATLVPRKRSDATLSYGFLTANALNADWSIVSRGGATCVESTLSTSPARTSIPEVYNRATHPETSKIVDGKYTDSEENIWKFERTADIVVINLGTNDGGYISSLGLSKPDERAEYFKSKMRDFVDDILSKNGNDTKIVFAFGMMTDPTNAFVSSYLDLVEEYTEKGISTYYCPLPKNLEGSYDHPSVEGHRAAAEVLTNFIKENVL